MASQAQVIYTDTVNTLLEPSGFQTLGIMSDAEFFEYLEDVIQDFLSRTGCMKLLFNMPAHFYTGEYAEPDQAMDVQIVSCAQTYLSRSSGWYLDHYQSTWAYEAGNAERWREDETPPKTLQIEPLPTIDGYQVAYNPSNFGYGVLNGTASAVDFDIAFPTTGGYGTVSGLSGPIAVTSTSAFGEFQQPGYGTMSTLTSSNGNIQMVATAQPVNYPQQQTDYMFLLPDSAIPYIKYGVLAKIWSQDGEYRDQNRASYAQQRFMEGVTLFAGVMGEIATGGKNAR
jgi:hypothetical protein